MIYALLKIMTTTNYAAHDTALLIIDPYNDFMSKGGKLYERPKETAQAVGFYDNMRKLIPSVRAAHIQVIMYLITAGEKETTKDGSI